ncbi:TadE/TadG family type IV pilus assembly protein [Thalassococcus lentus]|uniref:TadE/TadG family type IV pilus assembly protein n=1 Tax=Thalassococcus lentus TaxID=1210524 RepID=A0ABT4XVV3_9RHOB|nr:TadE/TadG family type IV pilus assembly protein [Thalassococcus lentus]MDA7426089.1 TadE/TadG family type IV pilus assembly protein [Thalassococcus lentus]
MMFRINHYLRRFRAEETGSASVEFVLYFTVMFFVIAAAVEMSYMNLRHAMLERSVDYAVRDIRLATGDIPSYADVKSKICTEAAIIDECESNLQLEMIQVDPRAFSGLNAFADCQNAAEDPRPVRNFEHGQDNQLMLLRACMKFRPMFPTTGLGQELNKDADGYAQLIVTSAFVQEPR